MQSILHLALGKGWGSNLLWLFLALFFKSLLLIRETGQGVFQNWSAEIYLLSLFLIPTLFHLIPLRIKSFFLSGRPGLIFIVLSVIISFDLQPFFENDFFRYFWEGAVLRNGYNPYQFSPLDLQGKVPFPYFYGIGYPELTGVYPPLGIILFSFLGVFGFKSGLLFLGFLSAFIIAKIIRDLEATYISPSLQFIVLLTLFREGIVHHHFEVIAFYPFWLSLKGGKVARFLGGFFSFHLKFVGGLVGFTLSNWRQKIFYGMSLAASFYLFYRLGLFQSSGFIAFQEKWLFAPGFINLLMAAGVSFSVAKLVSWFFFTISLLLALIAQLRGVYGSRPFLFVLICFFYFSPVYNSWYSLWPGLTLLFYGNRWGGLYLFLSPLTYLFFSQFKEFVFLGNLFAHLGFYFSLNSLRDQS
ncbi:MAG: hypothetical protein NXH75_00710 [Halobacteriovoraceae bacterium]|nr:hypothetical protein [Halobacteriovoraceae bacterium]